MPMTPGRWRTSAARCNVTRYYKPIELREVIGNVTIDVRDAGAHDPLPAPRADPMRKARDLAR